MFFRAACLALVAAAPAMAEEYVPGRVLVRYREGARPAPRGARLERTLAGHTALFAVADADAALAELRDHPAVAWIEREHVRRRAAATVTPDDALYPQQWALPAIHAPAAWARTTGSSAVVVAVLDSGILPHPELTPRLTAGWDFISDAANAGDGDGRDPDPTDAGDRDPTSSMLHGTHVAGIIGASADNGVGVAGVDWRCRVQPVRVLGVDGGRGDDGDIADAIRWAAGLHVDGAPDNPTPADVINLSFDGRGLSRALQDAVDDATARGAAVVAAAGNDGADAAGYAPGGLDGVISVGAADENGRRAAYSNFGARVTLLAPGGTYQEDSPGRFAAILSTLFVPPADAAYVYYAGTSQAAPYVAGAIALMKSIDPALSPLRARAILSASAGAGGRCAEGCGGGLLDLDAALALAAEQRACGGRCAGDQWCSAGECVSAPGVSTARASGCAVTPRAPPAPLLVLGSMALLVCCFRARRR